MMNNTTADEEESQPLFFPENSRPSGRDTNRASGTPSGIASQYIPRDSRPLFPSEVPDRPLFGVTNRRDKIINLIVGCITGLLFLVTLLCAFFSSWPPVGLHIYFVVCICTIFIAHIILIYWYRQGDLDPKFRMLIYYNALTMVLLNICALLFFFPKK